MTYECEDTAADQSNDEHVTNSIFPPHDFYIGTLSLALHQAKLAAIGSGCSGKK
jgi:hypothetical protein